MPARSTTESELNREMGVMIAAAGTDSARGGPRGLGCELTPARSKVAPQGRSLATCTVSRSHPVGAERRDGGRRVDADGVRQVEPPQSCSEFAHVPVSSTEPAPARWVRTSCRQAHLERPRPRSRRFHRRPRTRRGGASGAVHAPGEIMIAYRFTSPQRPPSLQEVPKPTVKPCEVLVKVAAAGVRHSDLHLVECSADVVDPRPEWCRWSEEVPCAR